MPKPKERFSTQSRMAILAGISIVLIVFAVILSNPMVIRNFVGAVGYSGTGGWSATGTMGGQSYNSTWTPNPSGYDVSGTVGSQGFNYAVTGSYPGDVGYGSWEVKTVGTVYQAPSDGLVVARMEGGTADTCMIYGYTDGNPSPSTIRVSASSRQVSGVNYDMGDSLAMPVKSGDYWSVSLWGGSSVGCPSQVYLHWLPLIGGPGGSVGPAGPQGPAGPAGPAGPGSTFGCQNQSSMVPGVTLVCSGGYVVTGMIGCRLPSLESAPATSVTDTSVTFNNSGPCSTQNYIRCCRLF